MRHEKNQTDRLTKQHKQSKGVEGIFGSSAKEHDFSVKDVSILAFKLLKKEFPYLEFRYREKIEKREINEKLHNVDSRLGVTLFVKKSAIKPDGGIIRMGSKTLSPFLS